MQWHLPRWAAVITIYAAFFVLSYIFVPRVLVSLASQLGQLRDTVPKLFATLNEWQSSGQEKISDLLELERLGAPTRGAIEDGFVALQDGTLEPPLMPLSLGNPDSPDGKEENPPDESTENVQRFSFITIDLDFPNLRWPEPKPAPDLPPKENGEPQSAVPGTEAQEPEGEVDAGVRDPAQRFDEKRRTEARTTLERWIDDQLDRPGPASSQLPEAAGEQVLFIGEEILGIPRNDTQLRTLQTIVRDEVRTALRREEYIKVIAEQTSATMQNARSWAGEQLKKTTAGVAAVLTGIFDFFLILMLTAFFLIFFPRVISYVGDLIPPQYREDYQEIIERIDTRLSGAIRGQVIICIVNGMLTYPGLIWCGTLFDAPVLAEFAILLSLVAMILSLIPIFGVILSTIPMVLLAVTQSFWAGAAVIAWICVIHAIEAYILNPHILGHSARMNPIIVVFALLAGKHFGGLVGALLAVPIASVVVATFGYYRRRMAKVYAAEAGVEVPADDWGD